MAKVFFYHKAQLIQEIQVPDWVFKAAVGDLSDQLLSNLGSEGLKLPSLDEPYPPIDQRDLGPSIVLALANSSILLFVGALE
ncbi:hypothetical protein L0F63_000195 [Massospora cicadina]|nr:hypothetical protein L0F63_000195 [Massospora cicadina]